ncbi:hypothetical protein EDB86DRAFT_3010382 [Lactarius hatsudake]|nr:hypothetical protein EDB86DRAFT_3010382 [Lactarius hatsudake]
MPVPSTALVTVLPSLYLNSKAQRLHPFPLPSPSSPSPPYSRSHSHTHPYRLRSHSRSSLSSVPPPFPLPLAVFAFAALLSLSLSSSPLPASFPPPLAPNLEWQWNIDPPTHRTSPPDTPEVSFGLYLTSSVSLQTLPDAHWPGLVKVASAGLTNAIGASVVGIAITPPDAHGPGLVKVASSGLTSAVVITPVRRGLDSSRSLQPAPSVSPHLASPTHVLADVTTVRHLIWTLCWGRHRPL